MRNILHITPHLGGGVGTVLLNWLTYDKSNCHTIVTLDYANEKGVNLCKKNNIDLFSKIPVNEILSKIESADITVIHFWNHPLLYDFIIRNKFPKSRIAIWSHISGANPPYVFNKKLLNICDKFIFSTPISYLYIQESPKLSCILSTGGTEKFANITFEKHDGYNIGYIGTVDFAKMHPDYVETISKTNADKIFIVGGDNEKEIFRNADNRFVIKGKVEDIFPILQKLDVFAYLLNPKHYGTGEQVLQEAMSAGVVPVVLNNPCEKTLVNHKETGLVAENLDEYIKYINILENDLDLRKNLSENAKLYAKSHFSLKNLSDEWNLVFSKLMDISPNSKSWGAEHRDLTSYDIFLESLGEFRNIFENRTDAELKVLLKQTNWSSNTKGTPKQYFEFLGGKELEKLCSLYAL